MSIRTILAKILRNELQSIGIRSLTDPESELIATRILERITDLELELAARELPSQKRPRTLGAEPSMDTGGKANDLLP